MRLFILFVMGSMLATAGTAFAQTCVGNCGTTRCATLESCQVTYEACFVQANGNPDAEAVCLQRLDACRTAADSVYVNCAEVCCGHGCWEDPCSYDCSYQYGMAYTRCSDQYWACLQNNPNPAPCESFMRACVAAALAEEEACLLACAPPCALVPVLPKSWGQVKLLYSE